MEPTNTDYKQMLTEIIKKQIVILGPQIAVLKARGVSGLKVSDEGEVLEDQLFFHVSRQYAAVESLKQGVLTGGPREAIL